MNDQPVDPARLLKMARSVGLGSSSLRAILFELPFGTPTERRHVDPCPLSGRELEILKRLGQGKVYKQIAAELTLSTSTVGTHLHNTYAKLGAGPRAGGASRYPARLAVARTGSPAGGARSSRRRRRNAATAAPNASMPTSTGEPWRPGTKVWCSSSVAA